MKIGVAGAGYVGLSNAVMLAQKYSVSICDIDVQRVTSLQSGITPIEDEGLQEAFTLAAHNISATLQPEEAYANADYILIATPTDYDPTLNHFNTESVEAVVQSAAAIAPHATKVLRSTLPIGYTEKLKQSTGDANFFFMPEFLREGHALHDSLNPSRIIVGVDKHNTSVLQRAQEFTQYVLECVEGDACMTPVAFMQPSEAEAVKLFSNAYLATRVAFFNELDTFAKVNGYDAGSIIKGVSLDPRIGEHYNNPSFGYGGYCLPKDTKQLSANYESIPSVLIGAVVDANRIRKDFIAQDVLEQKPECVGIYRLAMKEGTDDFRNSAVQGIIERLRRAKVDVIIYEPSVQEEFEGTPVVASFEEFSQKADIILANRFCVELADVAEKIYTRDLFNEN